MSASMTDVINTSVGWISRFANENKREQEDTLDPSDQMIFNSDRWTD